MIEAIDADGTSALQRTLVWAMINETIADGTSTLQGNQAM